MDSIGEIIKCRRKEFGLTQSRLAELSKIGINTLTQIESGEGNPTIKVLEKVLLTPGETIGLLQLMFLSTHYLIFQMGISSL